MLALKAQGVDLGGKPEGCVYVACTPDVRPQVFGVALALRDAGLRVEADHQGRSLKSQFKQADKLGASVCVVLGTDEVASGTATLRDMRTHEQVQVAQADLAATVAERMA